MPKLAVLVIHGMGSQEEGFSKDTTNRLAKALEKGKHDPADVAWQEIYWADIVGPREKEYMDRARAQAKLHYIDLRDFVVNALGDAVAYQRVPGGKNTTYAEVHARVAERVSKLYTEKLESQAVPLVVLAHSLGGHVMSNYIWDMQKRKLPKITSDFERMKWLAGMITFGSNIPLFTFAYDPVVPIEFPGTKLSLALKRKARWFNFFDPDDVLGYPLRAINDAYKAVVNADIPINAGSIFSSWNPLSHDGYWKDDDFIEPVAKFLGSFLP
jgi:hypothetical protein